MVNVELAWDTAEAYLTNRDFDRWSDTIIQLYSDILDHGDAGDEIQFSYHISHMSIQTTGSLIYRCRNHMDDAASRLSDFLNRSMIQTRLAEINMNARLNLVVDDHDKEQTIDLLEEA